MKAITVKGEIKTFAKVPKTWSDENGLHLNIGDGSAYGFKDVVQPVYDPRIEELANLHLDGDFYIYDIVDKPISETLSDLKNTKISELKAIVASELGKTDWYNNRKLDEGIEMPAEILQQRIALRKKSNDLEVQINALKTKKDVILFDINL